MHIPIGPNASKESATPMIIDEDAVHHISENPPLCDRSHVCARGVIAHTYNCT